MQNKKPGIAFFINPVTGERAIKSNNEYYYTTSHNIHKRVDEKQKFHKIYNLLKEHEYQASTEMKEVIEDYDGMFDVEVFETSTFDEAKVILASENIKLKNK